VIHGNVVGQDHPADDRITNHEYPIPPLICWLVVQDVPQRVPVAFTVDEWYVM
jgi:hypothetical protein